MGKPEWGEIGTSLIHPEMKWDMGSLAMVIGLVGTTVAPWMQFYMQSAVIEKGIKIKDYKYTLWDVIIGSVLTVVVAFFIIIACASTLNKYGIKIEEAKDAALRLSHLLASLLRQLLLSDFL